MQRRLVPAQVGDEAGDAAFILEVHPLAGPFVDEPDGYAPVQERQFPQTLSESLVVEGELREDLRIRSEADPGAGRLGRLEGGNGLDRADRHSPAVRL